MHSTDILKDIARRAAAADARAPLTPEDPTVAKLLDEIQDAATDAKQRAERLAADAELIRAAAVLLAEQLKAREA